MEREKYRSRLRNDLLIFNNLVAHTRDYFIAWRAGSKNIAQLPRHPDVTIRNHSTIKGAVQIGLNGVIGRDRKPGGPLAEIMDYRGTPMLSCYMSFPWKTPLAEEAFREVLEYYYPSNSPNITSVFSSSHLHYDWNSGDLSVRITTKAEKDDIYLFSLGVADGPVWK